MLGLPDANGEILIFLFEDWMKKLIEVGVLLNDNFDNGVAAKLRQYIPQRDLKAVVIILWFC